MLRVTQRHHHAPSGIAHLSSTTNGGSRRLVLHLSDQVIVWSDQKRIGRLHAEDSILLSMNSNSHPHLSIFPGRGRDAGADSTQLHRGAHHRRGSRSLSTSCSPALRPRLDYPSAIHLTTPENVGTGPRRALPAVALKVWCCVLVLVANVCCIRGLRLWHKRTI